MRCHRLARSSTCMRLPGRPTAPRFFTSAKAPQTYDDEDKQKKMNGKMWFRWREQYRGDKRFEAG